MSSGVTRVVTGAVTGTGAAISVATVGFKPRCVELYNEGGLVSAVQTDTMEEARSLKRITSGTMSRTAAAEGVTLTDDGFDLGLDSDLNVSGELIHFVAHE